MKEYTEQTGTDCLSWDEYETRYESNELRWMADFIINNLVFIKQTLKVSQSEKIASLLQLLWATLDIMHPDADSIDSALSSRYEILHGGIQKLFEQGKMTKDEARQLLEYTRRTLFGHLHLYLTCMRLRKQEKQKKCVQVMVEMPQFATDLDSCKEIV